MKISRILKTILLMDFLSGLFIAIKESFKTKRNNIDISGSILAKSNKGSFFSLNFFKNSSMPDIYSISNHKFNCIIDHMDRSYFLSQESNNWQYEYNKISIITSL